MKLTSTQKKAIVIWLIGSPIVAFGRYYYSKPSYMNLSLYWERHKDIFLDHLVLIYLAVGLVCFLLFFLMKDKPKAVKTDETKELQEKKQEASASTNLEIDINKE